MSDKTIADFTANALDGHEVHLSDYLGKVVVVVNTASKCGFTPQYAGLQKLWDTYRDRGLVVLGFPCNQFAGQEPGTSSEIGEFCQMNYGVTFPMFERIDVNGSDTHPLFAWLKSERKGILGGMVKWNFTKFLIGRDGLPLARFAPSTEPSELAGPIEDALGK